MAPAEHVGALPAGATRGQLVAEVARTLDVVPDGASAVVAVSGGPDSTAMAALVEEARPDLDLLLVHVRHGLRDDQEDADAATALAAALGARIRIEEVTVHADGHGMEDAARRVRHAALERAATRARATRILVGHTADDQAETVLLRLARGTGLAGLGAMRGDTGRILRPLLRIRRADVHAFVAGEGLPAVTDPTNADPAIRRVRVRQDVLPAMARIGGDPVGALSRLADLAASDEDVLDRLTRQAIQEHVVRVGPCRCVALDGLAAVGLSTSRRIVRHLLTDAGADEHGPPADHVEAALGLHNGAAFDLGTIRVSCGGGWLAVGPVQPPEATDVQLAVPGRQPWPLLGADVLAVATEQAPPLPLGLEMARPVNPEPPMVVPGARDDRQSLRLPADVGDLSIRTARHGDRIATDGGTRKLSDVVADAGVPRVVRPLLPVVTAADRVIWVPGLAADRDVLHEGRSQPGAVLHLVRQRHARRRTAA